ncbi:MAG: 16S rRNA (uracil(1498)-N(3))-methyltransferase [Oscillospiraceae bacterium]|nr:16S rRNA (uracil(1498)-N(3))-methyltransferase [Oscillospiraceae bacterium]
MFNFFVGDDCFDGDSFFITGNDYNHIRNVLRMKEGDQLLISHGGVSSLCVIRSFTQESVRLAVVEENVGAEDLPLKIYLYQGLPKGDKMELIIQKAVELGVHEIIPVEMKRCVVRLDEKKKKSKTQRWQAISESAAKQSKRCIIPNVAEPISFSRAMEKAGEHDMLFVPYESERGMKGTAECLRQLKNGMSVGIVIGPEGGFEDSEIELAKEAGGVTLSLGSRILRTETAAMTAVGMCMLYSEMNLGGDAK